MGVLVEPTVASDRGGVGHPLIGYAKVSVLTATGLDEKVVPVYDLGEVAVSVPRAGRVVLTFCRDCGLLS